MSGGASVNGKPTVSKTVTAGSTPAAPASLMWHMLGESSKLETKQAMNKIKQFVVNVKLEMVKVSWPAREELLNSAVVVLVSVGLLAGIIAVIDLLYTFIIGLILK